MLIKFQCACTYINSIACSIQFLDLINVHILRPRNVKSKYSVLFISS